MTLYERLKVYTLGREWSANKQDGNGPRCPQCDALRTSVEHGPDCELGKLCDDIRVLRLAAELEEHA